jgi:hypothetical protein
MIGQPPQQRLSGLDVSDNAHEVFWCLVVGVAGSGRQPHCKNLERSAQQNDVVELRMDCAWFSSQPATNRTSASSVDSSAWTASSRHT